MHPEIVDIIVSNAFNGMGDSTGNDDFGVSVAWIDLQDFLEDPQNPGCYSDDISREAIAYTGSRWTLAYWYASGNRDVMGFPTRSEMMDVFRSFEADYLAWADDNEEEN